MGKTKMVCPACGNTDINEMLVSYRYLDAGGVEVLDTTTLPKFLYYMEHPTDGRARIWNFKTPIEISCFKQCGGKVGWSGVGARIPTTRWGI